MDFSQAASLPLFVVFFFFFLVQFYTLRGNFSFDRTNYGLDVLKSRILHQETSIHSYINNELEIDTLGYEEEDEDEDLEFENEQENQNPTRHVTCNCNSGRLCIMDFLKRFKGVTFDETPYQERVLVKFVGPACHLELIKDALKRNKYEMVFGEPASTPKIHRPNLAHFLDAFCGIKVEENSKIVFVGHVNQLKFIKQQLKEYEYDMIFGDIESEEV